MLNKYKKLLKKFYKSHKIVVFSVSLVVIFFVFSGVFHLLRPLTETPKAKATYQFAPTGGAIVTGSNAPILGATAASTEGVNMGDWRGALADDNLHFGLNTTGAGVYNAYLDLGGVQLKGANKLIFQTEFDLDATAPETLIQVCDWVSSTGVDSAADSQCTVGGWRNLNVADVAINTVTPTAYDFQIYDGYWNASATSSISTPLSNFVNGSNTVRVRYFTPVGAGSISTVNIDYLRMYAIVNPVYSPSSATQISAGTFAGNYTAAAIGGAGQTGSDNIYSTFTAPNGTAADFYYSYKNIKTYPGANTILYRAETSCTVTSGSWSYDAKIWNFTTSSWESLNFARTCSTTDTTNFVAKNNVNLNDYVSNGEVRIGYTLTANASASGVRLDQAYIMIGTTNTSGVGEISFGSLSFGSPSDTRDLNSLQTANAWGILSADESNTQSFASYAFDGDNDVTVEEASAANIDFSVTVPTGAAVTGIFYATRHMSGVGGTLTSAVRDYGGQTGALGGWSSMGPSVTASLVYGDNITAASVASGGAAGWNTNPEDYIDTVNNKMNMRWRTSASGSTANNSVAQIDFAMVSIQWTEDADHPSRIYQFAPTKGSIVTGTNPPILGATAAAAEGVNMGDWRGALTDDNLHFGITSTTGGYNAYLDLGGVQLKGANKLIFQTEFDLDATAPATLVQVCDWVSSTGVNNAADGQCTGGGWRNLNVADVAINTVTSTSYTFEIYDGYWNTSATSSISTPLTNFVNASSTVRVRYFSTTNTTSIVNIDFLRLYAVVNPVYSPSSAVLGASNTATGDYSLTAIGGAGQTGSDNLYLTSFGTASAPIDFYFSFKNVETYTGANAILFRTEFSCTNTGPTIRPRIWNFTTAAWEDLSTGSIACSTTDATSAWARSGININDYVSNGEVRLGWRSLANTALGIRIDTAYMMIGTTYSGGTSEISFGSLSSGSPSNTSSLDINAASNSWFISTADESNTQSFAQYASDSDNDAVVEEAVAANLDFNVTVPSGTAVTGIFFANYLRFGAGAGSWQAGLKDYSGLTSILGGWSTVGSVGFGSLIYSDNITSNSVSSGGSAGWNTNPEDYVDTVNNKMNMAARTVNSAASTTNATAEWDFAMVSIQWVENSPAQSLTFSISDNTVGFGSLVSGAARYATADLNGTSTETEAHTITVSSNATGGYALSINGSTLTSGAFTIATTSANTASTVGSEQFGLRLGLTSGTGSVTAPYAASGFAFDTNNFPQQVASGIGDSTPSIYSARYIANIRSDTENGTYTSTLTYTATATF